MNTKMLAYRSLLLLLVAVCLFAYAVTVLPLRFDIPHECRGDSCFICLCISLCERLAGSLLLLTAVGLTLAILFSAKFCIYCAADYDFVAHTPVCLKVKLSN